MYGWAGVILRIDLSKEAVYKETLSKDLALNYIGGRGVNVKILYDEVPPGIDPLGPKNKLILGTGPLAGTMFPGNGRWNATAKSPLTGILGDGNGGGHWAAELKYAGYDHIVVEGMAKKPVYLWIDDDHVEIRDASHLWGRNVWETTKMIREELRDPGILVAAIGQAGENLVKFACIISDLSRAPGRTGTGAVMGSKKLKAIAVRGSKGVRVANPELVEKLAKQWYEWIAKTLDPGKLQYSIYGTPAITVVAHEVAMLPVRNWQTTKLRDEEIESVSAETFVKNYVAKSKACFACPLHCSHFYIVKEGPYAGTAGEGPEYEAVDGFGPRCGNTYFPSILHANNLVNQYGLDVVSTANAIAFAMHLYQEGVVTEKDAEGVKLEWGNHEAIVEMIHRIANRKGFGNILAEGVINAARIIKRGAEKYVIHSKGLTPISWELRPFKGAALGFATSTRGADHLRGLYVLDYKRHLAPLAKKMFGTEKAAVAAEYEPEGKARAVIWFQHMGAVRDALEVCCMCTAASWLQPPWPKDLAEAFTAVTGVKMDERELMICGERIWNLERAFCVREGITRKDDTFTERFFKEPLPEGPGKGELLDARKFNEMLDKYYEFRSWSIKTGIPLRSKLEELGLKYVADDLEKLEGGVK